MANAVEPGVTVSLDTLYRTHVGPARRLAYLLTGDPELAADLAHDAFLRAAAKSSSLRDPEAFGVYLRRAVVNAVRSNARHERVVAKHAHRFETRDASQDAPDIPLRDALWEAVLGLPARQRAAVVLRYYIGASEREMATALSCAPGTVKSLLSRALAHLRGVIDDA